MKKFLTIMLAFALLFGCMVVSSCGVKPVLDFEDVKDALEKEEYTVIYKEDMSSNFYIEETLNASKGEDTLTMIKFADKKSAKLYYKSLKLKYDYEIETI